MREDDEARSKNKRGSPVSDFGHSSFRFDSGFGFRHSGFRRSGGFTLTELLVVIGIILVLIGILIPATVAARYRSRMVKCASNLRQIGQGVMQFAADNGGMYPPRDTTNPNIKATWLYTGSGSNDQRTYLKNYIDFNHLYCPFCPLAIDWQNANTATVEWTYELWWGVQFQDGQSELFASRLGQPFTYKGTKYSVLASDCQYDWSGPGATDGAFSSEGQHPTTNMTADVHQDSTWYYSRWDNANTVRGPVDLNYLYNDGSVSTVTRVPPISGTASMPTYGPGLVAVPAFFYNPGDAWKGVLPTGR